MSCYRIVFVSLLMVLSASFVPSLTTFQTVSKVLAQSTAQRKTQANRLLILCNEQLIRNLINQSQVDLQSCQQALQIHQQINNRAGVGSALKSLGVVYSRLKNPKKAIEHYQQALIVFQELGDRRGVAKSLHLLGVTYIRLGDFKKAIEYEEQALTISKELGYKIFTAMILGYLGPLYNELGNHKKSVEVLQQSLIIFQEVKDSRSVGSVLTNLGLIYSDSGDYKKAVEMHQKSLNIAQQSGNRTHVPFVLNHLGIAYRHLGYHQKAIEILQKSLLIDKKLGNRTRFGKTLGNLGKVYLNLKDYKKAIDYFQQSLTIAKQLGEPIVEANALSNLGQALFKSKNLPEAEKNLKQAIKVWKSQRDKLGNRNDFKISIFEGQAATYKILQQVLIAQNKTDEALQVSESGHAGSFVYLLTNHLATKDNISSATEPTINQIKQIAKAQNSTLVQYSVIYDEFRIAGKPQVKESELYIWVIKPTGEVTFRKADLKPLWQKENTTLAELVTTSRQSIGARGTNFRSIKVTYDPDAPKATNKLKRLHELLINPIADLLPKNPSARVTFIPQESLFLVPFPALQDKNGKYLIEKHTILTSPSIQVLELTRQKRQQIGQRMGNNMLIVGNPTMPKIPPKIGETPQQLTPLPGAEQEAKAIAKLFGAKPLIGNQATETKVTQRLPQARLIHLATHGIYDSVQGLNSGIALTPSSENEGGDGLLTAGEILDLKLNAELVVLSACDTGRGRITGDGVIGLSRSWISAGVPSVLVSLWSVPDAPTAELMTEFYQNIKNNHDKATALRQAMLKTMKQHPNPRDWAAFTLIGEAE